MGPEQILELLRDRREEAYVSSPAGMKAVSLAKLQETGVDVAAVRLWVLEHGGEEAEVRGRARSGSLRPGRLASPGPPPSARYLFVPHAALAD